MRNWKAISFKEFKKVCGRHEKQFRWHDSIIIPRPICTDVGNFSYQHECCASFCTRWRKLGGKDIKVVKVDKVDQKTILLKAARDLLNKINSPFCEYKLLQFGIKKKETVFVYYQRLMNF